MCDKVGSACRFHYLNIKEVGISGGGARKERKNENNTNNLLPMGSIGERNSIYFQWISFSTIRYHYTIIFFLRSSAADFPILVSNFNEIKWHECYDDSKHKWSNNAVEDYVWCNVCARFVRSGFNLSIVVVFLSMTSISLVHDCQRNEFFIDSSEEKWNEENMKTKRIMNAWRRRWRLVVCRRHHRLCVECVDIYKMWNPSKTTKCQN